MINRKSKKSFVALMDVATFFVGLAVPVSAGGEGGPVTTEMFDRRGPNEVSPSGHTVLNDCQAPGAEDPEGWLDATASLRVLQIGESSRVVIRVRDARPDTYFTIWLRVGGTDSNGDPFGGNPVTGGKATALAPTSDLPELLASTGAGNGNDQQPNGFRTDGSGKATFRVGLDFPLVGGAYPFQRFPNWDPDDERLAAEDPAIHPVAIAGPQGPYTLRIVSHCTDDIGHGLSSGPREWWFDWTVAQ